MFFSTENSFEGIDGRGCKYYRSAGHSSPDDVELYLFVWFSGAGAVYKSVEGSFACFIFNPSLSVLRLHRKGLE